MPPTHDDPLPPELLAEVDAAWERAEDLTAAGLELHVHVGRITGRLRGELRLEDEVLLRVGPAGLLALACGDPVAVRRAR